MGRVSAVNQRRAAGTLTAGPGSGVLIGMSWFVRGPDGTQAGGDDTRTMESNVLGVLYKYSRKGRHLKQSGERGSYRYSLREEVEP